MGREGTHSQAALTLSHHVGAAAHSVLSFPFGAYGIIIASPLQGLPFGFNGAVVWDTDSVTNSGSWFPSWKGVEWEGWGWRGFQQSTKKPLWVGRKTASPVGPGQKSQVPARITGVFTFFGDCNKKFWFGGEEDTV